MWTILLLSVAVGRVYPQERIISSAEGRIVHGLMVRPEVVNVVAADDECSLSYDPQQTDECAQRVNFCEQILGQLEKDVARTTVLYHVVSEECILDHGRIQTLPGQRESAVLDRLRSAFDELSGNLNKSDFTGFDKKDLHRLIVSDTSFYSGFDRTDRERLLQLRTIALDWRALRGEMMAETIRVQRHCPDPRVQHQVRVNVSYVDEFCDGDTYCHCIEQASELLKRWPQDLFFAQLSDSGPELRTSYVHTLPERAYWNFMRSMVSTQLGIQRAGVSRFPFQGGNMLTIGDLLFIGRDVLENDYLSATTAADSNLTQLGLARGPDLTEDKVTEAIARLSGNRVFWVGTDTVRSNYANNSTSSCQPVFHIDLLMALTQFTASASAADSARLQYVLCVPDTGSVLWHHVRFACSTDTAVADTVRDRTRELREWILQTASRMDEQLRDLCVVPERIEVALPLAWGCDGLVREYHSYANAVVQQRDGKVYYHIPRYCAREDSKAARLFNEAKMQLGAYFQVTEVPGFPAGSYGGLHCEYLVLERAD